MKRHWRTPCLSLSWHPVVDNSTVRECLLWQGFKLSSNTFFIRNTNVVCRFGVYILNKKAPLLDLQKANCKDFLPNMLLGMHCAPALCGYLFLFNLVDKSQTIHKPLPSFWSPIFLVSHPDCIQICVTSTLYWNLNEWVMENKLSNTQILP